MLSGARETAMHIVSEHRIRYGYGPEPDKLASAIEQALATAEREAYERGIEDAARCAEAEKDPSGIPPADWYVLCAMATPEQIATAGIRCAKKSIAANIRDLKTRALPGQQEGR